MNFANLPENQKHEFAKQMMAPIESEEALRNWVFLFLGIELPFDNYSLDFSSSTSNPSNAIWQIYNTVKNNAGNKNPGYILVSCRAGYKTLSVAILELMLFLLEESTIAHMASIEAQSHVTLRYMDGFFSKLEPLLTAAGWVNMSQNKRRIEYISPSGKSVYITVIIATAKGANSAHTSIFTLDEADLSSPQAIEEAKYIPVFSNGIYPVNIILSTLKYAQGVMNDFIENAPTSRYKILKWNLLDVTETCTPDRFLPNLPKEDRYVSKALPLEQMSVSEYNNLPDTEKQKYELLLQVHGGCKECPLLPICKTSLSKRSPLATGGLYKPIDAAIQQFRDTSSESAEAQLLCNKPGSEGLVYPRFNTAIDTGNVLSIKQAYFNFTGEIKNNATEPDLMEALKAAGTEFYAGVDWGYANDFCILVIALMPTGEIWVCDSYSSPQLEFDDQLAAGKVFRDKYNIVQWFADQSYPSSIKTFTKNGMKCKKFTKDVMGGIEAVRAKISDSMGVRRLKVINTIGNKKVITAIRKHMFLLDGQGNITINPDNKKGIADICDTLRYLGQNIFPIKGTQRVQVGYAAELEKVDDKGFLTENAQMKEVVNKLVVGETVSNTKGRKGGFSFSF